MSHLERAVVLDTNVRRLVRGGMRPGVAVRTVATENGIAWTDVFGAIIDVRRLEREGLI